MVNVLPLVAALLLALPLVSELEHGTYRLAWTQGRTRGEWARNRLGLVLATGVVPQRTVPAVILAGLAYVAIRLLLMLWVRPLLLAPETTTAEPGPMGGTSGEWHLSWHWEDATGAHLSDDRYFEICGPPMRMTAEEAQRCADENGIVRVLTYHPRSRYWPLQLTETANFLVAAVALIGFAAWWMVRRVE